jgi:hypothetical protein
VGKEGALSGSRGHGAVATGTDDADAAAGGMKTVCSAARVLAAGAGSCGAREQLAAISAARTAARTSA